MRKFFNLFKKKSVPSETVEDNLNTSIADESELDTKSFNSVVCIVKDNGHLRCNGHSEILDYIEGVGIGEDMALFEGAGKVLYLVNVSDKVFRKLTDLKGKLVGFDDIDFDWNAIRRLGLEKEVLKKDAASRLLPTEDYKNGICAIKWQLSRGNESSEVCLMDDDSKSLSLYGIFDRNCNLLLPWQPIDDIAAFLNKLK